MSFLKISLSNLSSSSVQIIGERKPNLRALAFNDFRLRFLKYFFWICSIVWPSLKAEINISSVFLSHFSVILFFIPSSCRAFSFLSNWCLLLHSLHHGKHPSSLDLSLLNSEWLLIFLHLLHLFCPLESISFLPTSPSRFLCLCSFDTRDEQGLQ